MLKDIICLVLFMTAFCGKAQVGIQTFSPKALFHVDGQKNTPNTGVPIASQITDDLVITNGGLMGIGMINPVKSLDVNVNNNSIRLRNLNILTDFSQNGTNEMLIRNTTTGDVPGLTQFINLSQLVASNVSYDFVVTSSLNMYQGLVSIVMYNDCGRTMMAQFAYNGSSLLFIGGMARDVLAVTTVVTAGILPQNSVIWQVRFPAVVGCQDGGNSNQFNFDIQKIGDTTFRFTSRSNISKTINFKVQRL